jgi:hypothetical protein
MVKIGLRCVFVLALVVVAGGCSIPLGPWGGPAYELDTTLIGTGKQAIIPREDGSPWN